MTDVDGQPPDETPGDVPPDHDHAWRRVSVPQDGPRYSEEGAEYRCDLCGLSWST